MKKAQSVFHVISLVVFAFSLRAGTLTVSLAPIPSGTVVNLTQNGALDWVHWGLLTDTSIERKSGVPPQISDFTVLPTNGTAYSYRYADNFNGYAWNNGTPHQTVTNTPTGVWVYGLPSIGSGFRLSAPAGTNMQTLRVYVGAYGARGRFVATLSDGSALGYTNPVNAAINNTANGPSGVYTINYAAATPGQTLNITYTVQTAYRPDGNVTLQAAALSAPGANSLPFVALTSPAQTASIAGETNFTLAASASDTDGTVTLVEFYSGETRLGDSAGPGFSLVWSNPPAGRHLLTARAIDSAAGMSISAPVTLFVATNGGALGGTRAVAPTSLNLTSEGTSDWTHWGVSNAFSFTRRAAGGGQISNFNRIGTNIVTRYTGNRTAFSWGDGTPIVSAAGSATGVYISGLTNGFEFSAPADTNMRTLRVYCGVYGAHGDFQAWLSDFSGLAFTDTTVSNVFGSSYLVYTINYAAARRAQRLHVRYTAQNLFDFDYGNVNLQAATLQGPPPPPPLRLAGSVVPDGFILSFPSEPGRPYSAQFAPSIENTNWQMLTNFLGTGNTLSVTDAVNSASQRIYRVVAE